MWLDARGGLDLSAFAQARQAVLLSLARWPQGRASAWKVQGASTAGLQGVGGGQQRRRTPRPGQVPQRQGLGGQAAPGRYLDRQSKALPVVITNSWEQYGDGGEGC